MSLEIEQNTTTPYVTRFAVFPEYVIETREGKRIIRISDTAWGNASHAGWFKPENVSSLYSRLATVGEEKTLLRFVHQCGLLGLENKKIISANSTPLSTHHVSIFEDQVDSFLDEANDMRYILESWTKAQHGIPINKTVTWDYIRELWGGYARMLYNSKADEVTLTKAYLAIRVSKYICGIRPVANFSSKGGLVPGFAYASLSDAIWYQLYQDMTSNAEFKECPYCGSWHTGRGKFCPSPPNYRRSPCENAYHQKTHQERKKDTEEKRSPFSRA